MSQLQFYLALVVGGLCAAAFALSFTTPFEAGLLLKAFLALGTLSLIRFFIPLGLWADGAFAVLGAVALLTSIGVFTPAPPFFWMALIAAWLFAWLFVERLSKAIAPGYADNAGLGLLIPVVFGLTILVAWEVITRAGNVPQVILPPPSMIWARITNSVPTLLADFQQTFKAVLIGYALGCGLGFVVAILIDRSPFLKSGLLPLGNFVSALPIVGVAPIMVMWFGFDWQSKAAVVVIMTFFPMLVNSVAGLNASSTIERDLMRTYAAGYWQTLMKLRLPAAGPFIFNALKINSTLALIGAIVAEFFGTPIVGMGFRISTEVGRMNVDMVWAEIAVAAVAGSVFYGVISLMERGVTFWHPSVRGA
ncbi:ABC transporter permease [Devosia yakushimensis]|uniref:ABC transporter permease n=2 Tax=Devosia yakushimensis TaxID=470028 RepID=A0ABQ5UH38_9HYPH|nr:ABC transporter permease [Devosia yakushimensis]